MHMWDVSAKSWAGRTGSKPFPALDTDWRWNFEAFYKNLFTGGLRDPDFILRCFFLYFISLEESEYSVYQ